MNRDRTGLVLAGLVSLAAPVVVAYACTQSQRLQLGLILPPFGSPRVLFAHSLASLPLGLLLARLVSSRVPGELAQSVKGICFLSGILFAVLVGFVAVGISDSLIGAGYSINAAIRILWCLALQLPWCFAFVRTSEKQRSYVPTRLDLVLAVAVSVLLPYAYVSRVLGDQSSKFTDDLERGRLLRARSDLEVILDLGGTDPILSQSPAEWRKRLDQELAATLTSLKRLLPRAAPPDVRLKHAMLLATVDRLEEAEREMQPVAASNPSAKLLLAVVLQWRMRWGESSALYREVLEMQLPAATDDPQALRDCVVAYDGLAYNARECREYQVAEAAYQEALDRLPGAVAAHFHFRLGQQYDQAGRPAAALENLQTAAKLQPEEYSDRIRPLVDKIRRFTPACFLGTHVSQR
jgi:hypothetical protein